VVVNDDHESILQRYGYIGLQKFWGYEFDLLRLCDVIGHVTIGLGICGFLLAVITIATLVTWPISCSSWLHSCQISLI